MSNQLNQTSTKDFLMQYEWFCNSFLPNLQLGCDDFLLEGLEVKLASISQNMNALFQNDSYFVTKIRVKNNNDLFVRDSDKAVNVVLTKAFGPTRKFNINKMTDLESKIITAFNDSLYNSIAELITYPEIEPERKELDMTNLTFFIKDKEEKSGGKIIISIPSYLLVPASVEIGDEKFNKEYFNNSLVEVNIKIGKTVFSVGELKDLGVEDIVLLEDSNIQSMTLDYNGYEKDFRIAPNPSLIISIDNNGGEDMGGSITPDNLWDSIQVEMGAEFEKVKISLGELKNIEEGLVVDISSVYNNQIILKVEEKTIATGELVIINDRYGVKINKIFAAPKEEPKEVEDDSMLQAEGQPMMQGEEVAQASENSEEDFDYSDFELDDEDI